MNIIHPFVRVYQDCALCAVHRKDHLLIMVTKCKSAIENEATCAHDTMKEKGENIAEETAKEDQFGLNALIICLKECFPL